MGVVAWTTAAHADWFERNILAVWTPDTTPPFRPNARADTWPTYTDLQAWMKQSGHGPGTDTTTRVPAAELALAAAIWWISDRTHIPIRPVDDAGALVLEFLDADGDPTDTPTAVPNPAYEPVEVPPTVRMATLMYAFRWYRRGSSPDGVIGANEIQGVIRTGGYDADAEAMLASDTVPGLA